MISSVKEAFKMNFKMLDWMDEETREAAKEKADAITDMIGICILKNENVSLLKSGIFSLLGFPKFILSAPELDSYYGALKIEANEYFLNNVRSNQFTLRQNLMKLLEPVNKTMYYT
jgi:neprilysin